MVFVNYYIHDDVIRPI